jgi:hypothetical protein
VGRTALDAWPLASVASGIASTSSRVAHVLYTDRDDPQAGPKGRLEGVWFLGVKRLRPRWERAAIAFCLFALSLALYLSRLAPSVVPGDPGEYQLIAARWGIGHPPGYGFYAVAGNLFTRLVSIFVPSASFAWRANAFAAFCAALMVALCYSTGRLVQDRLGAAASGEQRARPPVLVWVRQEAPSILGGLGLATGIGFWQHAIHANAHILTALLATLTLHFLVRWWHDLSRSPGAMPTRRNRWLYVAAFLAGVSPTQHPLLVFAFPVYVVFGLLVLWLSHPGMGREEQAARGAGRPAIWTELAGRNGLGRVLLYVLGCGLLGLSIYAYYPIRCAISAPPPPGPSDMDTWAGFLRVVTARGLRGNLLGFSLGQILQRLWDVRVPLLMQFSLPGLLLACLGWIRLWWPRRRDTADNVGSRRWLVAFLLSGYLASIVFVTVNVLQDAVAYLLGPMAVLAVLLGLGAAAAMDGAGWLVRACASAVGRTRPAKLSAWASLAVALLLAAVPIRALWVNWTRMNLSSFRDAEQWLAAVEARFVGQGRQAVILAEWERMTTVYYAQAVDGREWDQDDLRFVPISAGTETPFLAAAQTYLAQGTVYLTMYRPQVAARYRLLPVPLGRPLQSEAAGWSGTLWQVLPAWPRELPAVGEGAGAGEGSAGDDGPTWAAGVSPVSIVAYDPEDVERSTPLVEVVGWRLVPDSGVSAMARPGDVLALDLLMRLPGDAPRELGTGPYYLPWVRLGETSYRFTTASRFNTPWWQPGEIVVERFELPVSWLVARAGSGGDGLRLLSLEVGMQEVSQGRDLHVVAADAPADAGALVALTEVPVAAVPPAPGLQRDLERALGNLRGEILLRGARIDGRRVQAHTEEPIALRPGEKLRVVLEWQSLRPIDDNYKVFVQLLDAGLQVRAQGDDKAPLGGSAPTLLWFPRWRAGTRITDTYVLDVPPDLAPGSYPLIVGMYGFSTFKRLPVVSYSEGPTGAPPTRAPRAVVQGDWITLAHLQVE